MQPPEELVVPRGKIEGLPEAICGRRQTLVGEMCVHGNPTTGRIQPKKADL
jgi:hypothetical protein